MGIGCFGPSVDSSGYSKAFILQALQLILMWHQISTFWRSTCLQVTIGYRLYKALVIFAHFPHDVLAERKPGVQSKSEVFYVRFSLDFGAFDLDAGSCSCVCESCHGEEQHRFVGIKCQLPDREVLFSMRQVEVWFLEGRACLGTDRVWSIFTLNCLFLM